MPRPARAAARSSTLLGRRRSSVRAYGSGVNLHYPLEELVAQVPRWVAAGFDAVKIKVGKPDLSEDLDRVAAVRDVLGPDRALMIDANQRWDLETATRSVDALSAFRRRGSRSRCAPTTSPATPSSPAGSRCPSRSARTCTRPTASREFLRAGAAQIVQPNIVRVGGITPFRRIADVAAEHGATLHPHLLPELSGQLALTLAVGRARRSPWRRTSRTPASARSAPWPIRRPSASPTGR